MNSHTQTAISPIFDLQVSSVVARRLACVQHMLIDGKAQPSESGQTTPIYDPAQGTIITTVADGIPADVDLAVAAARSAFESGCWSKQPSRTRAVVLNKLADLIEANAEELAQLETLSNGSLIGPARNFFVPNAADQFRSAANLTVLLAGQTIPISSPGEWHAYTVREPVGVVGQIVPWNAPLMIAAQKISLALAAGCTVVLKPAEQTPLTALRLAELAHEAGLPPGVLNIVTGGACVGVALAEHQDVDKISFTGSSEVGRSIVRSASRNLKKVSLELGGKSPVIVFPDADLESAAQGAASAIFRNSGQICVAGSRLYVHKHVFDRVVDDVARYGDRLIQGHGLLPTSQIGPLISPAQVSRVKSYIESGLQDGAEMLIGSRSNMPTVGNFVAPTVLVNTNPAMTVVREEIFGPVLCAMPFDEDDLDRIAQIANDTPFGLAASIWTRDLCKAHKLASRIRAGTIGVNAHGAQDVALPFGGMKESGWGRECGEEGLLAYTETKSISVKLQ